MGGCKKVVVAKQVTSFYGKHADRVGAVVSVARDVVRRAFVLPSAGRDGVFGGGDASFLGGKVSGILLGRYRGEYHDRLFGPNLLSHVLRAFGDKDATDPRDKVFCFDRIGG